MQGKHVQLHARTTARSGTCLLSRMATALSVGLALVASSGARADDSYPNRPITLIAPYSAGGDADRAARNFSAAASRVLRQSVVVLNKTGASGVIGSAQAIAAPPDGYTLLLARTGSQAILPAIQPGQTRYNWDDYTFISMLEVNPYGCVVNAKSPYKTFADLVSTMRTKGKSMNYGTAGSLTTNDMGPRQLFKLLNLPASQSPTQIPYRGTGDTVSSLMAGETDFTCGSLGAFMGLLQAGSLRALMVTSDKRMSGFPGVPTARELGYAEMEAVIGWSAIFAPPNLPAPVRDKLFAAIKEISKDPAWQAATEQTGSLPYILSPDKTKEYVHSQYKLYRSLGESLNLIDAKVQ